MELEQCQISNCPELPDNILGTRRWIGHVLRKKDDSMSTTALRWTPVGKKKTLMTQKNVEENTRKKLERIYLSWGQPSKQPADSTKWRTLVSALCAIRHEEDDKVSK